MKSSVFRRLSLVWLLAFLWSVCACKKDAEQIQQSYVEIAPERKMEVLRQVEQQIRTLPRTHTAAAYQQLQAYLKTLPEFAEVGYSQEGRNVWARFTDGTFYMYLRNRTHDPVPTTEPGGRAAADKPLSPKSARAGLPEGNQVVLMNALGSVSAIQERGPRSLKAVFEGLGYQVEIQKASIENLKRIQQAGVFHFSTHGGLCFNKDSTKSFYSFWTTDTVNAANEKRYAADIKKNVLTYATLEYSLDQNREPQVETHYCVSSGFVEKYMRFATNSIVYLDACSSSTDTNMQWAFLKSSGFSCTYLGWTNAIKDSDSYATSVFFFDRLLGANYPYDVARPETPPQRSFDLPAVYQNIVEKNLGTSTTEYGQAFLTYKEVPNVKTLLRPSIAFLEMHELSDYLYIHGSFGEDPGAQKRSITIDGVPVERVLDWSPEIIACVIRRTGKGSAGNVVVTVGEHASHPRALTEWRGKLKYHWPSEGTMEEEMTFDIHLRADVNHYRQAPGKDPVLPGTVLAVQKSLAKDSKATYRKGGSATHSFTEVCSYTFTHSWSSIQGEISLFDPLSMGSDPTAETFTCQLDLTRTGIVIKSLLPRIFKTTLMHSESSFRCGSSSGPNPPADQPRGFNSIPVELRTIPLKFDASFNIIGDKLSVRKPSQSELPRASTEQTPIYEVTMQWAGMTARFPPASTAAVRQSAQ